MSSSSMDANGPVTAATEAYAKVVLHCLKYPTQPVFGLLIGKRLGESGASSTATSSSCASSSIFHGAAVAVLDAVPLFHTSLMSAPHPLIDVGVQLVQTSIQKENDGCEIVGIYVANERLDDTTISPLLTPVLQHLQQHVVATPSAQPLAIWVVDNQQLTMPPKVPCITNVWYTKGVECPYLNGKAPVPSAASTGQHSSAFTFVTGAAKTTKTSPSVEELDYQRRDRMSEQGGGGEPAAAAAPLVSAKKATALSRVPLLAAADLLTSTVASHVHHFIEDFEDHLENPTINFVNQPLHELLMRSTTVKAAQ